MALPFAPLSPMGVVVLGMHRSGTSALTELLADLGLSPGAPEHLLGASPSNPRGHFEPAPLVQFNDAVLQRLGRYWHAPLVDTGAYAQARFDDARREVRERFGAVFPEHGWVYKDPRLCVMWPLYQPLFPVPPVGVFLARSPFEVAGSLGRRDHMSPGHALVLWEFYNRCALRALGGMAGGLVLAHRGLLADPRATVDRLVHVLAESGMEVDPADADAAGGTIRPELTTARPDDEDVDAPESVLALWQEIQAMAVDGVLRNVAPPSDALREAIDDRARRVNEHVHALRMGWEEPLERVHHPG